MTIIKNNPLLKHPNAFMFLISILAFGISSGVFMGVLNNYLHEILHISKTGRGLIEFPRELPGLLLILLIALLQRFSEVRILRLAFGFALLGVIGIVFTGTARYSAIIMMTLWSTGEHLIMPVRDSIAMHLVESESSGKALGMTRSVRNAGQLIGYYLIPLLFLLLPFAPKEETFAYFRLTFILAGIALIIGFCLTFFIQESSEHLRRRRLFFRKKFSKYYILELFFGARKQVFLTFAPFVLVLNYHISAATMALLYGIASTLSIFVAPLTGHLIDKWGYRRLLIVDAFVLMLLCIFYGFTHRFVPMNLAFIIISIVFILDSVLFVLTMARTIYVKSISTTKEEVTATLSTGTSVNHLVSIIIAMLGGFLWQHMGLEVLFTTAAIFGLGSFLFSRSLPKLKS